MKAITGLWKSKKKEGVWTGSLGNWRVIVAPNNFKGDNPKAPDYKIFLEEKEEQVPIKAADMPLDIPGPEPEDTLPF